MSIKRFISIFMILIYAILLVSCNNAHKPIEDNKSEDDKIELTLENYDDYLTVNAYSTPDQYYDPYDCYAAVKCEVHVSGNEHFKFEDVAITVKFAHWAWSGFKFSPSDTEPISQEVKVVNLNLAGNGDITCLLPTEFGLALIRDPMTSTYTLRSKAKDCGSASLLNSRTRFEILSISGTAEEY